MITVVQNSQNLMTHFPTSLGVSERANELMDERVAQYSRLNSWLLWTILHVLIEESVEVGDMFVSTSNVRHVTTNC